MCDNIQRKIKYSALSINLGGWLIWISLMEHLDYIRCVLKMFVQFLTHGIRDIVKPFPLD